MSSASTSRTIKFISKAGTYTASIVSPSGDLYQEFEGDISAPTSVYPDFASVKPVLYFVCTSSRVAEGLATPDSIDIYLNGTKVTFSGDTSTGTFAGLFKKIAPAGDNPYYGVQITGNIAAASGYAPAVIRMEAVISYGAQSDTIQADYTIPVQKATGSSYKVTIASGDNKNFVIREKGESVTLVARVYLSGAEITQNLSYEWEKMAPSGWSVLTGKTAQSLVVADSDIDTYGEYRVTVKRSGETLGSDVQSVMDASDPYDIDPHPSPEDETITEDTSGNDSVTYTPVVVKRGTTVKAMETLFYFVVKDAAGVYLDTPAERQTARSSCTVTRAQCIAGGGSDISVTITAQS